MVSLARRQVSSDPSFAGLLPSAHGPPATYPRTIPLLDNTVPHGINGGDLFDSNRPSITIRSALHARALFLTSLRVLRKATSNSPFLSDFAPQVTDLIFDGWPRGWTSSSASTKGKERADDTEARAVAASLEIVVDTLQDPVTTFSGRSMQLLAIRAGEALDGRLSSLDREPTDEVVEAAIDDALARVYARLWRTMKENEQSEGATEPLGHILASSLAEQGDRIVSCLVQPHATGELRVSAL